MLLPLSCIGLSGPSLDGSTGRREKEEKASNGWTIVMTHASPLLGRPALLCGSCINLG